MTKGGAGGWERKSESERGKFPNGGNSLSEEDSRFAHLISCILFQSICYQTLGGIGLIWDDCFYLNDFLIYLLKLLFGDGPKQRVMLPSYYSGRLRKERVILVPKARMDVCSAP